jgi:hypothetical protein
VRGGAGRGKGALLYVSPPLSPLFVRSVFDLFAVEMEKVSEAENARDQAAAVADGHAPLLTNRSASKKGLQPGARETPDSRIKQVRWDTVVPCLLRRNTST